MMFGRQRRLVSIVVLLAGGTLPATAVAQSPARGSPRAASAGAVADSALLAQAYAQARALPRLRSLLVHWRGSLIREHYFHGATRTRTANIKSASKSLISSLVGIAVARKQIRDVHQTIGELLPEATRDLDSAKRAITVEDLLTMRTGLQSTSFNNYGDWVTSRNWVRDALRRPMVAERGGPMIYSTGSTHLLSAILTRATGMSTHRYAERVLARPLGIPLRAWTRDPQGIYFGGNEMRMTPREMVAFGVLHLKGGRASNGTQVIPKGWIDSSWVRRTRSGWSDQEYGYGWWIRRSGTHDVYFAWGYGGQFIFVVPDLDLVVVTTSDASPTTRERGHLDAIYAMLDYAIVPAVDSVESGSESN
ncbi:MAG: beta-lactamase, partial [Geminicoccaceae bacterium]|nr:beta-lactamase [Geminicoccaceae bacterium]